MLQVNLDNGLMRMTRFAFYFGRNCSQLPLGQSGDRGDSQYRRNTSNPAENRKISRLALNQQAVTCGMKSLLL
jgi:hypothetical protein